MLCPSAWAQVNPLKPWAKSILLAFKKNYSDEGSSHPHPLVMSRYSLPCPEALARPSPFSERPPAGCPLRCLSFLLFPPDGHLAGLLTFFKSLPTYHLIRKTFSNYLQEWAPFPYYSLDFKRPGKVHILKAGSKLRCYWEVAESFRGRA
jgi:hypothetical protein